MNVYFTSEIRDCLDLVGNPVIQKTYSIYKWKYEKLAVVLHVPWTTQNFVISRCRFAEDNKQMNKDL